MLENGDVTFHDSIRDVRDIRDIRDTDVEAVGTQNMPVTGVLYDTTTITTSEPEPASDIANDPTFFPEIRSGKYFAF